MNLDPRLFLSPQPASLPPVPASWWLEQDATGRTKNVEAAGHYLDRTLQFFGDDEALRLTWEVVAIDSAQATPLSAESAEVHLLAIARNMLPAAAAAFKVSLARDSAVAAILVNSREDMPERSPQSVFPGETSRAFALPLPPPAVPGPASSASRIPWLPGAIAGLLLAGSLAIVMAVRKKTQTHPAPARK